MKNIFLIGFILIFFISLSEAAEIPEFQELMFGVQVGTGKINLTDLNSKLEASGYPSLNENYTTFGLEGCGIINKWLIGGEGFSINIEETNLTNFNNSEMHVSGGTILFNTGYLIYQKKNTCIYPKVGIGYGNLSLTINEKDEPSLDEMLGSPQRNSAITVMGFLLDVSLGIRHIFGKERTHRYSGLMLGANVGYMHSFNMDFNGTSVGITGPYIGITVGGGSIDK